MAACTSTGEALLRCALIFLYANFCLCQRDCTGVDCPPLENCIEEVLGANDCCASCLQKGCTCEGYQYYDCITVGFKNGKVPEGDSYFVDYGSTECSCPAGGGRISCNFISCPEMSPNCIEVSEPADGCTVCERIGCIHGGQKYEAGHSFHIDPCQVCHCPNQGGELMCYDVPDCDPSSVRTPMLAATTEEDTAGKSEGYAPAFEQQDLTDQFSTPYHSNGNLPLFKPFDKEEPEDYDYGPTDPPEAYPQSLVFPTQSSSPHKVISVSRGAHMPDRTSSFASLDRRNKLELRERYGVHDHPVERQEVTENLPGAQQSTAWPHLHEEATTSLQVSRGPTSVQSVSVSDSHAGSENPSHTHRSSGSDTFPLKQHLEGEKNPEFTDNSRNSESKKHHRKALDSIIPGGSDSQINVSHPVRHSESQSNQQRRSHETSFPIVTLKSPESTIMPLASSNDLKDSTIEDEATTLGVTESIPHKSESVQEEIHKESVNSTRIYEETTPEPGTVSPRGSDDHTTPMARFLTTTTTQVPVRVGLDRSREPGPSLFDHQRGTSERPFAIDKPGGGASAEEVLQSCCAAGQRWFTEKLHCNNMPLLHADGLSLCSVAQKQCCLSSFRESRCDSGVTSARGGDTCEADQGKEPGCPDDSFQMCCSCCSLGLRMREEGRGCGAHLHLGYPCEHIFLTCCEEEEGASHIPLRRKHKPPPSPLPRKVLDSKYPKEAFSIGATDEAANLVDEQEDQDQCRLYAGQLCQHKCTNVWGSYVCECHRGYALQPDQHSCAPVSPDEDNRLRDYREFGPAVDPTQITTASMTSRTTTSSPAHLNPCADNGPCNQQCAVVSGRARCSCFPGFSLRTDGHTCADVDECVTNTHGCGRGQRCVNTVGSFVCERQVTCPAGYQLRSGVCEDVDECVSRTHNCGSGSVCKNTVGSFMCHPKPKCINGFTQDAHGNCVDINECSSPNEPCSSGFNCINTVGSYTCQHKIIMCSHGYHASPDGDKCVDSDECQMGTHSCGPGQICHNLPGSFRCDCQTGYKLDALHKVCTDVNECWHYPGRLCAQTCENTPGSFHCSCTAGFKLALDGRNCEDVNECEKSPCSQECANIYGSYQCYCRQGYHLKEDGHTCQDIDECSQSMGNLCSFQCVNVEGSYQCSCPPHGYTMSANGRTCKDIDECTTGRHNCSHAQTCFNLQGAFRCLSFNCPHNYKKVSDTRCERSSCPPNSLDCQKSPIRITYYQLSFQTNIITPAQIFRIGPSPAYAGDHVVVSIVKGNEEGYFSTRKLNGFMGAVFMQRPVRQPKDFLIEVEMKLLRQNTVTSFLARIYVFITQSAM